MRIRLLDTGPAEPALTAAVDEVILDSANEGGQPTLHFFRRSRPAVSIGYFLKAAEVADLDFCREKGISILRRISGGGAIYTDEDQLEWGFASKGVLPVAPGPAFEVVCGAVVNGLRRLGLEATFSPVNDIVVKNRKIGGSAIFNRGAARLVHGAVIVDTDLETMFRALIPCEEKLRRKGLARPEEGMTTMRQELGIKLDIDQVAEALAAGFSEVFEADVVPGALTVEEEARARELAEGKYGREEWNLMR